MKLKLVQTPRDKLEVLSLLNDIVSLRIQPNMVIDSRRPRDGFFPNESRAA